MIAAALPSAGLVPRTIILLDPPAVPVAVLELMTHDPEEQPIDDPAAMLEALARAHPEWHAGDVRAKADGLASFDQEAVRAVLLDNGDWDGGLASLAHPSARDVDVWLIRGEWTAGGLIPDGALPALHDRLGIDHVVTIPGAPHSPQRTHLELTVAAVLRALGSAAVQAG
jgi:pimeloyl-ACP methyl ester carboxylesterase